LGCEVFSIQHRPLADEIASASSIRRGLQEFSGTSVIFTAQNYSRRRREFDELLDVS
jgi:hypothetical protein